MSVVVCGTQPRLNGIDFYYNIGFTFINWELTPYSYREAQEYPAKYWSTTPLLMSLINTLNGYYYTQLI